MPGVLQDSNGVIDAFLAKLSETHAIVPRGPTEAMEQAMLDALERREHYCTDKTVAEVYRAMIAAAEPK